MFGMQVIDGVKETRLAQLRKRIPGLSQEKVAELLRGKHIDISTSGYQRIERGETRLHFGDGQFIDALAEILQVSRPRLLAEAGVLPPPEPSSSPLKEWLKEQIDELDDDNAALIKEMLATLRKQKSR